MKRTLLSLFISGIETYSRAQSQLTGEVYNVDDTPVVNAVVVLKYSLSNPSSKEK